MMGRWGELVVPHSFLDGIWCSVGRPLHAGLTCRARRVVQFFFPRLCLPEVGGVRRGCRVGVCEGPHGDGRVRLVGLGRQVFGGRTGGGGDRLVGVEPLSIFTDPVRSSGTCCSGLASLTRSSS